MATLASHYPVITDLATSLTDQGPAGINLTNVNVAIADDTTIVPSETHKVWVFDPSVSPQYLHAAITLDPEASWSFCAWVKRDAGGTAHSIVSAGSNAGAQERIECEVNLANEGLCYVRNNTVLVNQSGGTTFTTAWTHVVATYDQSTGVQYFVNGTKTFGPVTPYTYGTSPANLLRFAIGVRAFNLSGAPFDGRMKDVRRYSGVLSQGEIDAIVADTTFGMGGGGSAVPLLLLHQRYAVT